MKKNKTKGYWNDKKICHLEALKYKTKKDFRKYSNGAYDAAKRNNWMSELCSHMKMNKPKGYWTFERCKKVALKCFSKSEFYKKYSTAYNTVKRNNWTDKICSHMKSIGNYTKRLVYVFEFSDKTVYVGLTYNSDRRFHDHLTNKKTRKKSSVFIHFEKTTLIPNYKLLTNYIDANNAAIIEEKTIKKYKKNGWFILNKAKAGSLGSTIKWTKEKCIEVAKKCKTRIEFQKKYSGASDAAYRNKWYDDCCKHMIEIRKANNYWTKEKCLEEALKYKRRCDFKKNSSGAYASARKNGWLDKICVHMLNQFNMF